MGQMRVTSCRSLPSRLTQTAPCPLPVTMGRGRWAAHGVSLTDSGTEARRVPVMCFTEPQGWDHHAGRQPRAPAGDELDALPRTSEPALLPVIVLADAEFAGCCPPASRALLPLCRAKPDLGTTLALLGLTWTRAQVRRAATRRG